MAEAAGFLLPTWETILHPRLPASVLRALGSGALSVQSNGPGHWQELFPGPGHWQELFPGDRAGCLWAPAGNGRKGQGVTLIPTATQLKILIRVLWRAAGYGFCLPGVGQGRGRLAQHRDEVSTQGWELSEPQQIHRKGGSGDVHPTLKWKTTWDNINCKLACRARFQLGRDKPIFKRKKTGGKVHRKISSLWWKSTGTLHTAGVQRGLRQPLGRSRCLSQLGTLAPC